MKDNYIKIEPFMIKKLRLSGYDLLVYAIIYGFTKSSGEYIGGYRYMTKEFGFDKSTIYRALCRLKTVNLIEVEKVGTSLRIVCNMQTIDKYANCIQTVCKTHTEEYAGRIQTVCKMQPKNTNKTNKTASRSYARAKNTRPRAEPQPIDFSAGIDVTDYSLPFEF